MAHRRGPTRKVTSQLQPVGQARLLKGKRFDMDWLQNDDADQGGRGGQVQSEDGSFKLKLAVPKKWAVAARGRTEMLFAAPSRHCFEHSIRHIANADKLPLRGCYVEARCRCT